MRPLVVETRHRPSHSSSSTAARDRAQISVRRRRHADRATLRRDADRAELPRSSTLPDSVPTITSAPAGHRTSTASDGRRGPDLDGTVPRRLGDATTIDDHVRRGSAVTLTPPETALIRTRSARRRAARPWRILASPAWFTLHMSSADAERTDASAPVDLAGSARGWHGVQLAVLAFIGVCGS